MSVLQMLLVTDGCTMTLYRLVDMTQCVVIAPKVALRYHVALVVQSSKTY